MRTWLVWGAAAALTGLFLWQAGTALADPVLLDETHPAYVLQQRMDGSTVTLKVASAQAGPNILRVRVEQNGRPDPTVQQVALYPTMPGHEMLLLAGAIPTERMPDGEFRADTGTFEMFGTWDLVVGAQRAPESTATATFALQLAPTRPQIALFAGVPLTLLVLGLATLIVMWRRSLGTQDNPEPTNGATA